MGLVTQRPVFNLPLGENPLFASSFFYWYKCIYSYGT
jgi:hypothetical protein